MMYETDRNRSVPNGTERGRTRPNAAEEEGEEEAEAEEEEEEGVEREGKKGFGEEGERVHLGFLEKRWVFWVFEKTVRFRSVLRGEKMDFSLKSADPLDQLREGLADDLAQIESIEEVAPILRAGLERVEILRKRGENNDGLSPRTGTFGAD